MGEREKICRDAARPPGRSSSSIWGLRLAQAVRAKGKVWTHLPPGIFKA